MNVLHKSLNLSGFAQVSVCPLIYRCDGSFMGLGMCGGCYGGCEIPKWYISLRRYLKINNHKPK